MVLVGMRRVAELVAVDFVVVLLVIFGVVETTVKVWKSIN